MAGHFVKLAALLMEAHPQPPLRAEDIGTVPRNTREGEDHHADQGAVA